MNEILNIHKKNEGGVGLSQADILTITNGEYLK